MKIFKKYYVRRLYRTNDLKEILTILKPWIKEVLYDQSPFLRQVAAHHLRKYGSSYSPRFFKTIIAKEIMRINDSEDLEAILNLAIVESYRSFNPAKTNMSLVTWFSWRVPYEFSKVAPWKVTHPIEPFEEPYLPAGLNNFNSIFETKRQIDIISKDLGLDRRSKQYYLQKVEG